MKKALMLASVASMIEKFNMDNIEFLRQQGYKVDVAANFEFGSISTKKYVDKFREKLEKIGIYVHNITIPREISKIGYIINSYRNTKKICKENNYKIVHCHSPVGGVIARIAARKIRKKGTKVIYTAHGFHFFKGAPIKNWLIYFPAEWICSFFTDILITINKEDFEFAKKHMHAKKVYYIPGVGIDTDKYANTVIEKSEKRKSINVPDNAVLLMSVGEIVINKNHEVIIRAMADISEYDIHYCIAGKGDKEEFLKNIAKQLGIEKRVHFLGYREDVNELLKASDIFCFPSFREGLPVSLMEAIAAGLPCIVSNIRGNTDLVTDGVNGILCNPEKPKEFTEAIKAIISNKKLKFFMESVNSKTAEKYDIKNVSSQMRYIYLSLNR